MSFWHGIWRAIADAIPPLSRTILVKVHRPRMRECVQAGDTSACRERINEARGGARGGTCGGGLAGHGILPPVGYNEKRALWSTGRGKSLGARRGGAAIVTAS